MIEKYKFRSVGENTRLYLPFATVEYVRLDNTFRMESIQIIFSVKFPKGFTTSFQNKIQHDVRKTIRDFWTCPITLDG